MWSSKDTANKARFDIIDRISVSIIYIMKKNS